MTPEQENEQIADAWSDYDKIKRIESLAPQMLELLKAWERRYTGGSSPYMEEIHPTYECNWCGSCAQRMAERRRAIIARAEDKERKPGESLAEGRG